MVLVQYQEEYFYFVQNTELNRSEWLKCASGSDSELENTVRKWFQWKKQTIGVKCGAQSTQTSPFSSFLRCSCNSSLTFSTWIKMGVQVICVILRLKLNQPSPQNHFRRKCIIMHHHTIKLKPSRQNTTQSFGIAKIASAQLCLTLGSLTVSYMWLWMAFWQSAQQHNGSFCIEKLYRLVLIDSSTEIDNFWEHHYAK